MSVIVAFLRSVIFRIFKPPFCSFLCHTIQTFLQSRDFSGTAKSPIRKVPFHGRLIRALAFLAAHFVSFDFYRVVSEGYRAHSVWLLLP